MIRLSAFLKAAIVSAAAAPLLFYWSLLAVWQVMGEPAWNRADGLQPGGLMVLPLLSLYYGLIIGLVTIANDLGRGRRSSRPDPDLRAWNARRSPRPRLRDACHQRRFGLALPGLRPLARADAVEARRSGVEVDRLGLGHDCKAQRR